MLDTTLQRLLREDCGRSVAALPDLARQLTGHRIAVVGGTGFVGSWLAEMIAMLNDDHDTRLKLDLYGRSAAKWAERHSHLVRSDITATTMDARSPFELHRETTLVLSATGIADPRVWASEPHHVFQTTVYPLNHTLAAANRLEHIQRVVLLSSGLVAGLVGTETIAERDIGALDFTRVHNVYAEARRAAESLAHGFASQYRLPLSTTRPFTFLGPYQHVDAPWALNNFLRDALNGHEIRLTGDGTTRRSYLYGSDVAAWLLQACMVGQDGGIYNIGGAEAVSHAEAAQLVAKRTLPEPRLVFAGRARDDQRSHDFVPDLSHTQQTLGVRPTMSLAGAIERTLHWHAAHTGLMRRLRIDGLQAAS